MLSVSVPSTQIEVFIAISSFYLGTPEWGQALRSRPAGAPASHSSKAAKAKAPDRAWSLAAHPVNIYCTQSTAIQVVRLPVQRARQAAEW